MKINSSLTHFVHFVPLFVPLLFVPKIVTSVLNRLAVGIVLASVPLLGGCDGNAGSWQEEVKLSDGRVITVTQRRRYEGVYTGQDYGSVVREAWLIFRLREFDRQDITWHENLKPRILNLHNGKLYIVGFPPTGLEFDQYGKPKPSYIGFRYENGKWQRIPFAEIPEAIYDTNLWIENLPPSKSGRVSLGDKAAEMRDAELRNYHKRIDPNFVMINF